MQMKSIQIGKPRQNLNLETSDINENVGDSQDEIESFIQAQKSKNTLKKTTSDMNNFMRYLAGINNEDINILRLPASELDHLMAKILKMSEK